MRIDPLKSTLDMSIKAEQTPKKQGLSFVDAFQEAIAKVNNTLVEADKTGLDLASGKNGNIHEAMIQMQKADIEMRLLVASVNKLIEGYNELMRLR
jgi:flagellar hook-basal body complex protein FliE